MVFRTLSENGSTDFAHFAYLDRSYQYLQLLYWHQVLEKPSWAFRGHFRSKFWGFSKKNFQKSKFFKKIFFFRFFDFFRFELKNAKKVFFSIVRSGHLRLRIFHKKVKNRNFSTSKPLFFLDFAHLADLDRSHQYLQLLYWHQVLEKPSWAFRGHFRSNF